MNVGDKVLYAPHLHHAKVREMGTGKYSWVFAIKKIVPFKGKLNETVVEMSDKELYDFLQEAVRYPNYHDAYKNLIPVRPGLYYSATVKAVNEDGTVNLDIDHPHGGITWHYNNITVDLNGMKPHTCHPIPESKSRVE